MKKILLSIFAVVYLLLPQSTLALNLGDQYTKNAAAQAGFDSNTNETSLSETIGTVIKTALSLVGTIFLALTVYAGFLWMTASGDESQIEKAQNIIRAAVIGLVIALGAYGTTTFVVDKIVQKTATTEQAP